MPVITIHQFVVVCFFLAVSWAAIGDLRAYKIPNRIVLLVIGFYPAHVLASPASVPVLPALLTAAIVFFIGLLLFNRGVIGGGDVKLIAAVSLWAGPENFLPFLILCAAAGGLVATAFLVHVRRQTARTEPLSQSLTMPIPYGIAIAVGGAYVAGRLLHAM